MVCGPGELDCNTKNGMDISEAQTSTSGTWRVEALLEGCTLMVEMKQGEGLIQTEMRTFSSYKFSTLFICLGKAEILKINQDLNGQRKFYVHYTDCNRRLDEWVTENRLDLRSVVVPSKLRKSLPAAYIHAINTTDVLDSQ